MFSPLFLEYVVDILTFSSNSHRTHGLGRYVVYFVAWGLPISVSGSSTNLLPSGKLCTARATRNSWSSTLRCLRLEGRLGKHGLNVAKPSTTRPLYVCIYAQYKNSSFSALVSSEYTRKGFNA